MNAQGTTTGVVWSFTTGAQSAADVVTITKAQWDAGKRKLDLKALSNGSPDAVLTVVGFGQMTFRSDKDRYELKVQPVDNPGTVTVTSSLGGSDSASVTIK